MKKVALFLIFIFLIALMFTGCGSKVDPEPITEPADDLTSIDDVVGGFSTYNTVASELSERAQEAFDEATADYDYTPLACVGTQVVAGTNYAILVKDSDNLKIVFIYKPLQEEASITSIANFNILDYLGDEINIVKTDEGVVGGWNVPTDGGLTKMPQELATATSVAFGDYKDLILTPLACVGTQVVAGTNYALVCAGQTAEGTRAALYMVKLYDGVDGTREILSISPIDVTALK